MNYTDVHKQFIWNVRLDFDPVGIRFVYDKNEIKEFTITHKAKAKITYCQFLAACRQQRSALFMEPGNLLCQNAQPVFNFRELDKKADTKRHMKYLQNEDLAWQAPQEKARLGKGCLGIYMAPLDYFDMSTLAPSIVFFVATPYQAYYLLNDYMGATHKANLEFFHTPNSAICSGSVYSHVNHTANMTTMCAGSKTSGKTEMNYVNLFIPGDQINAMAEQQKMRVDKGQGASLLGKGSQPWPGLDACKGCPLFKFEKI